MECCAPSKQVLCRCCANNGGATVYKAAVMCKLNASPQFIRQWWGLYLLASTHQQQPRLILKPEPWSLKPEPPTINLMRSWSLASTAAWSEALVNVESNVMLPLHSLPFATLPPNSLHVSSCIAMLVSLDVFLTRMCSLWSLWSPILLCCISMLLA